MFNYSDAYKEEMIQRAYRFASVAHKDQYDKGGKPYIEHVMTVASEFTSDYEAKVVALLHDVVEDTIYTIEDIASEGFGENVINALKIITRDEDMDYMDYIERISFNEIARKVKMVDLKHNMDLSRISGPSAYDIERVEKYKKALEYLQQKINGEDKI